MWRSRRYRSGRAALIASRDERWSIRNRGVIPAGALPASEPSSTQSRQVTTRMRGSSELQRGRATGADADKLERPVRSGMWRSRRYRSGRAALIASTIPGFAINPFGLNVPLSGGTNAVTIPGFAINPFGLNVPLSGGTNAVTIPGFAINPFGLDVPLSGGTSPVTIPGFAINPFGLNVPLSGGTNAVTIPGFAINPFGLNVPLSGGTTPAVRPDVTCPNDTAADPNSSASPSHAAAAASNGLDPAPEYISTELISGGRTGKFNRPYLCRSRCVHTSSSHHDVVSAGTSTN